MILATISGHPQDQSPAAAVEDWEARMAAHFPPSRYLACLTAPRFQVSVVCPDGTTANWQRTGGSTCVHAQEAQEFGGLGSVVRVVPLDMAVST